MKEKILVIGANGNTGRRIVDQLKKCDDYEPVAMVRREHQMKHFEEQNVEVRLGDLEEDFSSVFDGIVKVIFAAGAGSSTGDEQTELIDKKGAIKSIDISKEHGIKKYVMLSSMGTDIPEQVPGLEVYLKAKKEADDYLRESGLSYTIIQPGGLTDHQGDGNIMVADKLNKFGKVSRDNVAAALIESLKESKAKNVSFEMLDGDEPVSKAIQ